MQRDKDGCTCYDETTERCPLHSGAAVKILQTGMGQEKTTIRLEEELLRLEARVAQLEEALREINGGRSLRSATTDQLRLRAGIALTSSPSSAAEVLRAAKKFYDATPRTGWSDMGPLWKPMAELCEAVRKYEEGKQ